MKMISLAAVAAVAAMALVGASSASASVTKAVLCKVNQELCAAGNLIAMPATIKALSTLAVLLGTLSVKCHSSVTIVADTSDSDRILGKITELTWSSCTGCTNVTTTTLPTGSVFPTAGQNGTLLTTSLTAVLLQGCLFGIHCTALASDATLTFLGGKVGSTAKTHAHEVPVTMHGGFGCGSSGKWDAQDGLGDSKSYVITSVNGSATGEIWISKKSHA